MDALICGGGVAAYVVASRLHYAGARVLVLSDDGTNGYPRLELLSRQAQLQLAALGFLRWPENAIWNDSICASWESEDLRISQLPTMALRVDRGVLDKSLRSDLVARGVDVRRARIGRLAREGGVWTPVGISVTASVVVDATGSIAAIARHLTNTRALGRPMACIATSMQRRENDWYGGNLLVEAARHGWWYSLVGDKTVIGLVTTPEALGTLSPQDFFGGALKQTHYTRYRSEANAVFGVRTITRPLRILDTVVDEGWIAVGDAAAPADPLSGLGVERAIGTGTLAAATIMADMHEERRSVYAQFITNLRRSDTVDRAALARRVMYRNEPFWKEQTGEASTILSDSCSSLQRLQFDAGDSSAA